ncbi:MAG: chemotaxis protein CheB, partial [Halioglobus sp.]
WSRLKTICFPVNKLSTVAVGIILSDVRISLLLKGILSDAGYSVHIGEEANSDDLIRNKKEIDVWVFDAQSEKVSYTLSKTQKLLLPVDDIPSPEDTVKFRNWSCAFLRKIDLTTGKNDIKTRAVSGDWNMTKGVWVLAGSAGATTAVQSFLNAFTTAPPVGFLYAQHFSVTQQKQLQQLTAENPIFKIYVGVGDHMLAPGRVIMVPPQCKINITEPGKVSSTHSTWGNNHTPNIDELLVILSAANLPSLGVIVFSGMGDDGVKALPVVEAAGGHIWVQSPSSSICDSMPKAALKTELVHKTGDPVHLAKALEALYTE